MRWDSATILIILVVLQVFALETTLAREHNCDVKQRLLNAHFRLGEWSMLPVPYTQSLAYRVQQDIYELSEQGPTCAHADENVGLSYYWKSPKHINRFVAKHLHGSKRLMQHPPYEITTSVELCKLLAGRNIMIVGDSLNFQFYSTMIQFLWSSKYANISVEVQQPYRQLSHGHSTTIDCGDDPSVSIHFVRNYGLWLNSKDESEGGMYYYPWVRLLSNYNISILVLNRGAHYSADDVLLNDLTRTFEFLRDNYMHNLTVIWRDTPYGHAGCAANFSDAPMSAKNVAPVKILPLRHWENFKHQNQHVEQFLRESHPWVYYMNAYTMTIRRADSHRLKPARVSVFGEDCLHYCIPGPLDHWVQGLAFILRVHDYPFCRNMIQ